MLELQFKNRDRAPVPVVSPGLTIGSDRISGVVIDEKGVKGFHADLRVERDAVFIEDVGTGIGTFVNGRLIGGAVELQIGDEISISGVTLVVAELGSAAHADTAADADTAEDSGKDTQRDPVALDGEWGLRAESGPLEGKVFAINGPTKVGRALECQISIPEARLSREHAELHFDGERLVVRDLDSSNGTYHNGARVREAVLSHGDMLALDTLCFRVIGPAIEGDETVIGIKPERIGEDSASETVADVGKATSETPAAAQTQRSTSFPLWGIVALMLIAIGGGAYYYLFLS